MELEGTVTNVTNFGAFVDLGVHQDGLVHISELSHKYIQDARQAVKVGDVVKVKVIGVDPDDEADQPVDEGPAAEASAPAAPEEENGRSPPAGPRPVAEAMVPPGRQGEGGEGAVATPP